MTGTLNEQEIINILSSQAVGRIALTDGKFPYIVPVTFVYDGHYIYGQTREGMKLDIVRKNPHVCFQVEVMTDMKHWQSVLVRGEFEELKAPESEEKGAYFLNRMMPIMTPSVVHAHEHEDSYEIADDNRIKPIMYRIKITEKTGRYENI